MDGAAPGGLEWARGDGYYSHFRHPSPLTLTLLLYVVSISFLFRNLSNHNDNSVTDRPSRREGAMERLRKGTKSQVE